MSIVFIKQVKYFNCLPQRGIFAPIGRVYRAMDHTNNNNQKQKRSSNGQRLITPVTPRTIVDNNGWSREGSIKCISSSRSSYSINFSLENNSTQTNNSTIHHGPINVSHVTAKVDTGLFVCLSIFLYAQ